MASRNIPKKIKNIILEKFRGKCAFPNCKWPAVALHHTKRFSIVKRHHPEEIVPLCKTHHELAHAGLIANEEEFLQRWRLQNFEENYGTKTKIDMMVRAKRKLWAVRFSCGNKQDGSG